MSAAGVPALEARRHLRRVELTVCKGAVLLGLVVVGAAGLGILSVREPVPAIGCVILIGFGVLVWDRPQIAAYLVVGITPLVAGIDRGTLIPVFRPNEAMVMVLSAVLATRALIRLRAGQPIRLRLSQLEVGLVALATCASVVPLVWMVLRGQSPTGDDVSYALVLWKYLIVYALIRGVVHTDDQVRRCVLLSVTAAVVVAAIGILQARGLLGVTGVLSHYYVPFGANDTEAARGGSTLALPAATADLLAFNLALVMATWAKTHRHAGLVLGAAAILIIGTVGAAQFSGAIGLVTVVVVVAIVLRRREILQYCAVGLVAAIVIMQPLVSDRLTGFQSVSGFPVSWTTRLYNLQTYFWPELFSGSNVLLGVRPSARVVVHSQRTGYVWIESGYTWLLWGGGIPLLLAFCYVVWRAFTSMWQSARALTEWSGVAAVGALAGLASVSLLMLFDPHLTYRGSADCLFCLLALAAVHGDAGEGAVEPRQAREPGQVDHINQHGGA